MARSEHHCGRGPGYFRGLILNQPALRSDELDAGAATVGSGNAGLDAAVAEAITNIKRAFALAANDAFGSANT
jgi:hypothetical protein